MSGTLLPFAFVKAGRHRMVKLVDPERLDWRYGFFGLGLPDERPIESFLPFEQWCAQEPAPAGFGGLGAIFHVSRCGSTLLAQNLKATERAVVLSEPPFLRILRGRIHDTVTPDQALRAVALALSQWLGWAEAQGKRLIVKFNSQVHVVRAELMNALEGAQFLFLHREPAPVLESIMRGPPPYLERESGRGRFPIPSELAQVDDDPMLLAAASRYCAALDAFAESHGPQCPHVAYRDLPARFGEICAHFGVGPVETGVWRADRNAKSFDPDRNESYRPVAEERLAAFIAAHREVLEVTERRYKSYLRAIGG